MGPIGVFDSGYGGLTVLKDIVKQLPGYDYLYLGDNARAPYGTRSYESVYRLTLQAVKYLFSRNCPLVILACNTASAKALRTIQQRDLPQLGADKRVLGVIRPTAEAVGSMSDNGLVGIVGTPGTVGSHSYDLEITKLHPSFRVYSHACPMWVPLVENREMGTPGAQYFVKRDIDRLLEQERDIDTLILGCTHYPLLLDDIVAAVPKGVKRIITQGDIVAKSLADYLQRHPEMEQRLTQTGNIEYVTTEDPDKFCEMASLFMGHSVRAHQVEL